MTFFESPHCQTRAHCQACRTSAAFRRNLVALKLVDQPEFACPFGMDGDGLGDKLERLFKPIAKALRLPCLDQDGKLKPESGCAQRRHALNRLGR